MKKIALVLFVFALSLTLTWAQDETNSNNVKKPDVTKSISVTKGTHKPVNSVCIVSGEEFDSKITADYKGKTYAFCCKKCLAKFTKDPEKYVTKFEKQSNKTKN